MGDIVEHAGAVDLEYDGGRDLFEQVGIARIGDFLYGAEALLVNGFDDAACIVDGERSARQIAFIVRESRFVRVGGIGRLGVEQA